MDLNPLHSSVLRKAKKRKENGESTKYEEKLLSKIEKVVGFSKKMESDVVESKNRLEMMEVELNSTYGTIFGYLDSLSDYYGSKED